MTLRTLDLDTLNLAKGGHDSPDDGRWSTPMLPDRFMLKVGINPGSGCWEWLASKRSGYGAYFDGGRMRSAHRVAYEVAVGQVPDGLELDHLCRNRACVNPAHLEPVTSSENKRRSPLVRREQARRGREAFKAKMSTRTSCGNGHPYTDGSLYLTPNGTRSCRTCNREAAKRYRESGRRQAVRPSSFARMIAPGGEGGS